jgi:hypothetical protein
LLAADERFFSFLKHPDRLFGLPNLIFKGKYTSFSPAIKRLGFGVGGGGCDVTYTLSSNTELKNDQR